VTKVQVEVLRVLTPSNDVIEYQSFGGLRYPHLEDEDR